MVCVLCLGERRIPVRVLSRVVGTSSRDVWVGCPRCTRTNRSPDSAPSRVTASDAAGGDELASLWVDTNGGES